MSTWIDLLPFTLLLLVLGPIFLLMNRADRERVAELLDKGLLAEAEILEGKRSRYGYDVRYTFTPIGRQGPIVCETTIQLGMGKSIPIGTKVPVRYKASYPFIAILVPYARR